MQLIAMHHISKISHYIEGFNKQYKCIVCWRLNEDFVEVGSLSSFKYDENNSVTKFTNPFER